MKKVLMCFAILEGLLHCIGEEKLCDLEIRDCIGTIEANFSHYDLFDEVNLDYENFRQFDLASSNINTKGDINSEDYDIDSCNHTLNAISIVFSFKDNDEAESYERKYEGFIISSNKTVISDNKIPKMIVHSRSRKIALSFFILSVSSLCFFCVIGIVAYVRKKL